MFGKLRIRVVSAFIFVPLILIGAYLGGPIFFLMILALALFGGYEFGQILKKKGYRFIHYVFVPSVLLLLVAAGYGQDCAMMAGVCCFVIFALHAVFFIFGRIDVDEMALSFFGLFYIGFTLSTMALIRANFTNGFFLICMVFLIQWMTDTGAYFVGSAFGRHKLMPKVSPKKSVEGAFGGILIAMIVLAVFNLIAEVLPMPLVLMMTFFASILGQIGDLFESALKRWADVKDAGTLIPGHGGILDRFDSLFFIAPFCYYFLETVTYLMK